MRQFLNKAVTVMLVAFLALSLSACGGDSDDDNDLSNDSKMTGWVKIDGKKYDFNYFYGTISPDGKGAGFSGFNKNLKNLKEDEYFNQVECEIDFNDDGTLDKESVYIDFEINCMRANHYADMAMYCTFGNVKGENITASISGNKITIDGKDVKVHYNEHGIDGVGSGDPTTTIDFHIEGTPRHPSEVY